jgi:hypothetical protein
MCTGMELMLANAAISAGGAFMQNEAANDAADEQRSILNAAQEENQNIAKQGEDLTNDFAEKAFDPSKRDARYEQGVATQEKSLGQALASANSASPGSSVGGRVSADFTNASNASRAASNADAAKQAKLMARAGGSGLMYGAESMMGGQLASDLGGVGQRMRRNSQYAQNAAGSVQNNGSLAGSLLQGGAAAASAYGAYKGMK